jgi:hypothetical protein
MATREQRIAKMIVEAGGGDYHIAGPSAKRSVVDQVKIIAGPKPGDQLKKIIWDRFRIAPCGKCLETMTKMNENGVQWCRDHVAELAAELNANAKSRAWTAVLAWGAQAAGLLNYELLIVEACDACDPPDTYPLHRTEFRQPLEAKQIGRVLDLSIKGFGDLITAAYVMESTKDTESPIVAWATDERAYLLDWLNQPVVSQSREGMIQWDSTDSPYQYELKSKSVRPRVELMRKFWGIYHEPVAPTPRPLPAVVAEWCDENAADVILYPHSAHANRTWPLAYYVDLYHRLIDAGLSVLMLLGRDEQLRDIPRFTLIDWPYHIGLIQRSKLVIGNDSAGVHLAGAIGTPALAITGATRADGVFAHAESVHGVAVNSKVCECVGCYFQPPDFVPDCNHGCHALMRLPASRVFNEAEKLLCRKP